MVHPDYDLSTMKAIMGRFLLTRLETVSKRFATVPSKTFNSLLNPGTHQELALRCGVAVRLVRLCE